MTDDNDCLMCPGCGETGGLHQGDVAVYTRSEDEPQTLGTVVEHSTRHLRRDANCPDLGPSARRHGLVIAFSCEHCEKDFSLAISQHKGLTQLGWVNSELHGGLDWAEEDDENVTF